MSVKKILICLALMIIMSTLTFTTGCAVITGSGNLTTRNMEYSDFTKIDIGHAFEVEIIKADSYLVRITLDDNLYDYLDVTKRGDTLYITLRPNHLYTNATQKAFINLPDLHRLELSGASKADVRGFSNSHSMDFELSGASQMEISRMKAGDITLELSGASKASGSIVIADGTFDLSGASSIELEGSANDVYIDASGASRASLSDFSVVNAEVDLSGASQATINASGQLAVDLSGASRLNYTGNPRLESVNVSGGSSISQK